MTQPLARTRDVSARRDDRHDRPADDRLHRRRIRSRRKPRFGRRYPDDSQREGRVRPLDRWSQLGWAAARPRPHTGGEPETEQNW